AAGERDRLEGNEADLVAVLQRELDDRADLVVVDGVDNCHDQAHVDARRVQVFDGPQLDVQEIPDLPVTVGGFGDTVELQIRNAHAGRARMVREGGVLRETD